MSYPGRPYYPEDTRDVIAVDFEHATTRVARTPHQCQTCGQPIRPGQRYTRIFAVIEGEPATQLHHGLVNGECLDPNDF